MIRLLVVLTVVAVFGLLPADAESATMKETDGREVSLHEGLQITPEQTWARYVNNWP